MPETEPKKFFVKDFIKYGSPCFGCGRPNNFKAHSFYKRLDKPEDNQSIEHTTRVLDKCTEVNLFVKYHSDLTIFIFHKTNKIVVSNPSQLENFLSDRYLFLSTYCNHCNSFIESTNLNINKSTWMIEPLTLLSEYFILEWQDYRYIAYSYFLSKELVTSIHVTKQNSNDRLFFEIPLLPKYQIKTRQALLERLQLLTIFS